MSYYRHHVFFCLNQRDGGENCCNNHRATELQEYAKKRIKELKLSGRGLVRMNKAGCLDRCDEGPIVVVYPEEVWYTYATQADIDEIIDSHIRGGKPVERLRV